MLCVAFTLQGFGLTLYPKFKARLPGRRAPRSSRPNASSGPSEASCAPLHLTRSLQKSGGPRSGKEDVRLRVSDVLSRYRDLNNQNRLSAGTLY